MISFLIAVAARSVALVPIVPPSPRDPRARSSAGGTRSSSLCEKRLVVAPLHVRDRNRNEGNESQNGLLKSVDDIFNQLFPKSLQNGNDMFDLTSSLTKISDFAKDLPASFADMDIPDIIPKILTSSVPGTSERGSDAPRRQANGLEPVSKDVEDALRLANKLAAKRGLGDMIVSPSSASAAAERRDDDPYLNRDHEPLLIRDIGTPQERTERNKGHHGVDGSVYPTSRAAELEEGDYMNVADLKQATDYLGTQREWAVKDRNRNNDVGRRNARNPSGEGEGYMNAADVKAITGGLQPMKLSRNVGQNSKKLVEKERYTKPMMGDSGGQGGRNGLVDNGDVWKNVAGDPQPFQKTDAGPDGGNRARRGDTTRNAPSGEIERFVDAAAEAWSSLSSSKPFFRPHPPTDDAVGSSSAKSAGTYSPAVDRESGNEAYARGYADAVAKALSSPKPFFRPRPPADDTVGSSSAEPASTYSPAVDGGNGNGAYARGYSSVRREDTQMSDWEKEYDVRVDRRRYQANMDKRNVEEIYGETYNPRKTYFHGGIDDDADGGTAARWQANQVNDWEKEYDVRADRRRYRATMDARNIEEIYGEIYNPSKMHFHGGIKYDADGGTAARWQADKNIGNSRKIVITDSALDLARSLKLDIYEISRHRQRQRHGGGADAAVNELDVRDYLDQRYERLFSALEREEEQEGRRRPRRTRVPPRGFRTPVNPGSGWSARGFRPPDPEEWDSAEENDSEAFYGEREDNGNYGWKPSRSHRRDLNPELRSQRFSLEQQQKLQRQREETFHRQHNSRRKSYAISPISSVPLSQLLLPPRLEKAGNKSNPRTSGGSTIGPISSVPLSELISKPTQNPLDPYAESRQAYQEQNQSDAAAVENTKGDAPKPYSFQEIPQSKFREPYKEQDTVYGEGEFAEQRRQAIAQDHRQFRTSSAINSISREPDIDGNLRA